MPRKIEQVWHPYWLWEDWKAGMYAKPMMSMVETGETKDERMQKCINLLTNQEEFYRVAKHVTSEWIYACEHNLTNYGMNRIAYIGQASCCYEYGITEEEVRSAWAYLTDKERAEANATAQKVIEEWEDDYIKNNAR